MTRIKIKNWADFAKFSWDSLLIGNGASIAIYPKFSYGSLYDLATKAGRLSMSDPIFRELQTTDFEYVLRVCWHADLVNSALAIRSPKVTATYTEVRSALIETVGSIHPDHSKVRDSLVRIGKFASRFRKVISLNYDFTLYWAALLHNDSARNWFKDAFVHHVFEDDWEYLESPFGANAATTMIFYPHGSLILGTDVSGEERKLVLDKSASLSALLPSITEQWNTGTCVPLFVSEGTSRSKIASIRRSAYLSSVYDRVLTNLGRFAVIYGFSFSENDEHIIDAIEKNPPAGIFVSVFGGDSDEKQQGFCHEVLARVKRLRRHTKVAFFSSNDPGCWANL